MKEMAVRDKINRRFLFMAVFRFINKNRNIFILTNVSGHK
jgi:hypothetical protein